MADTRRSTRICGLIAITCVLGTITSGCRTPWQNTRFSASELAELPDADGGEMESRQGSPLTARLRPGPRSKPRPGDEVRSGEAEADDAQEIGLIAQIRKIKSEHSNLRSAERNSTADAFIEDPEEILLDELPSRSLVGGSAGARTSMARAAASQQQEVAPSASQAADSATPALTEPAAGEALASHEAVGDFMAAEESDSAAVPEVGVEKTSNRSLASESSPLRIRISDHSNGELVSPASGVETLPNRTKAVQASTASVHSSGYVNTAVAEQAAPLNIEAIEPASPVQNSEPDKKQHHALEVESEPGQDLMSLAIAILDMLETEAEQATDPGRREELSTQSRLLRVILDDLSPTENPMQDLAPEAQQYIRDTLQALQEATHSDSESVARTRMTEALESHRNATHELANIAQLRVLNLAFCTEIDNFGVIKKFPRYRFRPKQQVLLYCELENFVSKSFADGYETRLGGFYKILDANGQTIVKRDLPEDRDLCANHRSDFYIGYLLTMPESVAPGSYRLLLSIEDIHGKKSGQAEVEFRIDR